MINNDLAANCPGQVSIEMVRAVCDEIVAIAEALRTLEKRLMAGWTRA